MADISILSRLIDGTQRNVDVSQNSLVVGSLKVGTSSPTELTKTILNNLVALQSGADFATGTNAHTHDGRYFTETEVGSTGATSGADLVGVNNTPSNYSAAAQTVQDHLEGIDSALASAGASNVKVSGTDTTPGYLAAKVQVDIGSNTTDALEESILNPAGNEVLRVRFDQSKVDHGSIGGLADDDHTQYILVAGTRAYSADQSMGGFKLTNLGAPTANGHALRYDQLGANSGIATLDAGGKIPVSQLPSSVMTFEGIWDASTNTPTLADATGDAGMVYLVTVAGTQDLGSGNQTFAIGDWVVANSSIVWQKSINSNTVVSVNGATGVVTVNAINQLTGDVTTSAASGSQSLSSTISNSAVTLAKMASNSVDENKLVSTAFDAAGAITGGGGSKLAVQVDGSTIEISSNALRVKDAGVTLAKMAALSVDENKLTASVAGNGLTGGAGSALAVGANADGSIVVAANDIKVAHAPAVKATSEVAGEAFAATTLFAVRYGQDAETAGRMYKADNDATTVDNFYAVGLVTTVGALSAADPLPAVVKNGLVTSTAHGFTVGKPVFLDADGALTSTAPSTANLAVVRIGLVKDANTIDVQIQVMGVN